nr:InlB B-repeat-containing protein [Eubacterium sp.]
GWTPIGTKDEAFSGVFDGNGHSINNMYILVSPDLFGYERSVGFFGMCLSGVKILNLSVIGAHIELAEEEKEIPWDNDSYMEDPWSLYREYRCGIVVGYMGPDKFGDSYCTIENCYANGEITGLVSEAYIGGVVGSHHSSSIRNCYSDVNINIKGNKNHVCGVCNSDSYGKETVYSVASIKVDGEENKISSVGVEGFYLSTTGSDSKAKALTETQMKSEQFFTGFDFEETWFIDPYSSYAYPQLRKVPATKLKEIKMVSAPAKNKYYTTEKLDLTGAKVMLSYEDGKEITIDIPESMVSYEMKAGTTAVKVSYLGKETTFDIFVEDGSSVCYFDENGGDTVYEAYRELEIGEKYGELPKAERDGYIFNGWYTKKQGGDAITDETVASIPGDDVVYAHWTKAKLKKVKGLKVSSGSKMIGARWSKTKNAIGYEIMYSLNSSMSSTKTVQTDKLAKTIKGVSAKTKYYLQIRAYTEDSKGNKVYGKWSKKVSLTTKQ